MLSASYGCVNQADNHDIIMAQCLKSVWVLSVSYTYGCVKQLDMVNIYVVPDSEIVQATYDP